MIASVCFVGGQLLSLVVQTVIVVILEPSESDPTDTLGYRMAIMAGVILGAPACICKS